MIHNKVHFEVLEKLVAILGTEGVVTEEEKLQPYSHDETPEPGLATMPDVVVKPTSAQEIADILKLANEKRIAVTPRGAGSGLSGGAIPCKGGIVLSLEKMNRILEFDEENLVLVTEPGVITADINKFLEKRGLFYPGYPMSKETCFIGGNVAENSGGSMAVKYGVTGRYVLGLDVVLPTGEIITLGGKRVKDVTGYNLLGLMVGSEGTLGIFTKIILKLLPLPKEEIDLLFLFDNLDKALQLAPAIMSQGKIIPAAIEFIEEKALQITAEYTGQKLPQQSSGMLLVKLQGETKEHLLDSAEKIGKLATKYKPLDILIASDAASKRQIWHTREMMPEAVKASFPVQIGEDIVVPVSNISTFLKEINSLTTKYNTEVVAYGHAGDGNVHTRILKKEDMSIEKWRNLIPAFLAELYDAVAVLGGTISGEHGIGCKRSPYLKHVLGETEIEIMKKIKTIFDPQNILNPGKIF